MSTIMKFRIANKKIKWYRRSTIVGLIAIASIVSVAALVIFTQTIPSVSFNNTAPLTSRCSPTLVSTYNPLIISNSTAFYDQFTFTCTTVSTTTQAHLSGGSVLTVVSSVSAKPTFVLPQNATALYLILAKSSVCTANPVLLTNGVPFAFAPGQSITTGTAPTFPNIGKGGNCGVKTVDTYMYGITFVTGYGPISTPALTISWSI